LIALLRGRQVTDLAPTHADHDSGSHMPNVQQHGRDELTPARGIALAVVLGAVSWTALAAILWLVFGH
jgi:hypothetical protein